jgi:hypothetical protein
MHILTAQLRLLGLVHILFIAVSKIYAQSNDNFANRIVLTGTTFTTSAVTTDSATIEAGEPVRHKYHSIWYSWTAPSDLRVTLNNSGSSGTEIRMSVYVGNSLATLCAVTATSDQTLSWVAVKGVNYQIAVDRRYSYSSGSIILSLTSSFFGSGGTVIGPDLPTTASPSNDNFSNRKVLLSLPLTVIAVNGGGTRETAEPTNGFNTLWYSYTATADQWLNVRVESFVHNYNINIYHGNSYATMQLVPTSSNSFSVLMQKGSTYHISVANYYDISKDTFESNFLNYILDNIIQLAFSTSAYATSGAVIGPDSPTANSPNNDNFSARKTLSGSKLSVFGINTQASRESFEPTATGYRTLWYSWGTNQGGAVTVNVGHFGSQSDSQILALYTGAEISSLKNVVLTKVSGSPGTYTFNAEANVTYQIALGSYYSDMYGLVSFDLAGPGAGASAGTTSPTATPRLTNLATRGLVGTGGDLMFGGFTLSDTRRVLIRAVGPTLASFGVSGTLADPKLEIYQGSNLIASNDNWGSGGDADTIAAIASSVGAFALNSGSKDAVIITNLGAGGYTAQVSGVGGTTGVAIIEVYELP